MKKAISAIISLAIIFSVVFSFGIIGNADNGTIEGWQVTGGQWTVADDGSLQVVTNDKGAAMNYCIALNDPALSLTGDYEITFEMNAIQSRGRALVNFNSAKKESFSGYLMELGPYGAVYYDIDADIKSSIQLAGSNTMAGVKYEDNKGNPAFNEVKFVRKNGVASVYINGTANYTDYTLVKATHDGTLVLGLESDGSIECAFRNVVIKIGDNEYKYFTETEHPDNSSDTQKPIVSVSQGNEGGCGNNG